jgi:F0F1-type ATP synthase membrane subunit b/b'
MYNVVAKANEKNRELEQKLADVEGDLKTAQTRVDEMSNESPQDWESDPDIVSDLRDFKW